MKNCYKRGFTLVELLIVIAIIGVLSTVVLSSLTNAKAKSRDTRRLADLQQIHNALELYFSENASYPVMIATSNPDVSWTEALQTALLPFLNPLPRDPSSLEYRYSSTDSGRKFGLAAPMETEYGLAKAEADGGYYADYYEMGPSPKACKDVGKEWWGSALNDCP